MVTNIRISTGRISTKIAQEYTGSSSPASKTHYSANNLNNKHMNLFIKPATTPANRALLSGVLSTLIYAWGLSVYFQYFYPPKATWVHEILNYGYYDPHTLSHRVFLDWVCSIALALLMGWQYRGGGLAHNLLILILISLFLPFIMLALTEHSFAIVMDTPSLFFLGLTLTPMLLLMQSLAWLLAVLWSRFRRPVAP